MHFVYCSPKGFSHKKERCFIYNEPTSTASNNLDPPKLVLREEKNNFM